MIIWLEEDKECPGEVALTFRNRGVAFGEVDSPYSWSKRTDQALVIFCLYKISHPGDVGQRAMAMSGVPWVPPKSPSAHGYYPYRKLIGGTQEVFLTS